jgi:hypothetical protein
MNKPYIVIFLLLGLIFSLSVGKAVLHNSLSTSGIFINKIEKEIAVLKTQNALLSEDLLVASSLRNITEKAKQLGFTNENTLMVIKTSKPLAIKQ